MEKHLHNINVKTGSKISWFFSLLIFFILSINLSGQKIYSILGETWTSGTWLKSSLITYTYDGSGYLTNTLVQSWDIASSTWKNVSQTINTNNPDGTVNQSISQAWDGVSAWTNVLRATYTYNASKKPLTIVSEIWLVSIWMNSTKTINTYDGSGYLTNSLTQTWDLISSTFKNSSQTNYTNNPNGTINFWISQTYVGTTWTDNQRATFTYNASNKVLTEVLDNMSAGNWVHFSMDTDTYDGSGYITNNLHQLWDVVSSTWKDKSRSIYTNNPDGTPYQVVSQDWDGISAWVNTTRATFSYSPATGIYDLVKEADFNIYPNPAGDVIRITSNKNIQGSTYSITDQAGKLVLKGRLTDTNTTIDISPLPNGIYFFNFGVGTQNSYKVIKNRSR